MKMTEIRKLSMEELTKNANSIRVEITKLRHQNMVGELSSPRDIRKKRKDLARVLTVMGEQLAKEEM
jgi:large subunit ribosomal protein L29